MIAAPPVPVVDPVASTEAVVEDGKAAIVVGYVEGQDFRPMFDRNPVKGRDGSGPYRVVANGVLLPDGAYAPVGGTFDPVAEKCSPIAVDDWLRRGMIVPNKQTKEFKGELITKG